MPYGYHNVQNIRDDLAAAGFTDTTAATIAQTSRAASAKDAAIAFCQGTPLRSEIEARGASRLDEATEAAAAALARRFGAGPSEARIQAHVLTAMR